MLRIRTLVINYRKFFFFKKKSTETGRRWGWKIKIFSHNAIGVACMCECVCECVRAGVYEGLTDWWGPPLQETVKLVFLKYYFNLICTKERKKLFRNKRYLSTMFVLHVDLWPYQVAQFSRLYAGCSPHLSLHNLMCCCPPELSALWSCGGMTHGG